MGVEVDETGVGVVVGVTVTATVTVGTVVGLTVGFKEGLGEGTGAAVAVGPGTVVAVGASGVGVVTTIVVWKGLDLCNHQAPSPIIKTRPIMRSMSQGNFLRAGIGEI